MHFLFHLTIKARANKNLTTTDKTMRAFFFQIRDLRAQAEFKQKKNTKINTTIYVYNMPLNRIIMEQSLHNGL